MLALSNMGDDAAELVPDLLPHLESDDSHECQAAMMAISSMGQAGQVASAQLKEIADTTEDTWRRHYAALALLRLHADKPKVTAYGLDKLKDIDLYDLGWLKRRFPAMFEELQTKATSSTDEDVKKLVQRMSNVKPQ